MSDWSKRRKYTNTNGRVVYLNEGLYQIVEAANILLALPEYGGEKEKMTIVQGSWSGAAASAGTHKGPDALDITAYNWKNRVRVFRILGVAMWYRPTRKNLWSAHCHGITVGGASNAKYQEREYLNRYDGLAGNGRDKDWRPANLPIKFRLDGDKRDRYARIGCHTYDEPAAATRKGPNGGQIKPGDKITGIIAVVKDGDGDYWWVNKKGQFGYEDNFSITKPEDQKPEPIPEPKPEPKPEPTDTYKVVKNDTLSGIGAKLGIKWQDIAAWNNIKAPYTIHTGQTLKVTKPEPPKVEEPKPAPAPSEPVTAFHLGHWNVASAKPGWFSTPWSQRDDEIGELLSDLACSIITVNETHYSYMTADILKKLGKQFKHVSSPIGNDIFYDGEKYKMHRPYKEYDLKAQNRRAGVLHLTRISTGQKFTIVNTHLPNGSASLRTKATKQLVKLLGQVDDPIILTGDFNNQSFKGNTPHGLLRKAGYEFLREQGPVVNGDKPEFPKKGQWLCDMATDGKEAKLTDGYLALSPARLSDHRPFKGRVEIA